jgi:AraC-like DNA-binding protein
MGTILDDSRAPVLNDRATGSARDWIKPAPAVPGFERIEAFFSGHAYDPHRHDTYAIGITLSGVQRFTYRGVRSDSRAGNIIVLHPDEVHDGRAGIEAGFRYRMLYLEPRWIAEALGARAGSLPFVPTPVSSDERLVKAAQHALGDLDRRPEDLDRDHMVLALADALLALDSSVRSRAATPTCRIAVDRAREFLDAQFHRTVSSRELEALTGLDRYALTRHFQQRLGTSPYRYLTMRRLDHVRSMLALATCSLAECAAASGFADQSHMTRQFKKAYGMSPGKWRSHLRCSPCNASCGSPRAPSMASPH